MSFLYRSVPHPMKRTANCFGLLLSLLSFQNGLTAAELIVESTSGPVTAKEIAAFKSFMAEANFPASNVHNAMVYGSGGAEVEALGLMYEVTGDQEILDRMIVFSDRMLA